MKFKSVTLGAVFFAAIVAGASTATPLLAVTPTAKAEVESDYVAFRQTAERFRLYDTWTAFMKASMQDPDYRNDLSASVRTAYFAAYERRFKEQREVILDIVMRDAFKSFSHDEIVRLSVIADSDTGIAAVEAILRAASSGESDSLGKELLNEPRLGSLTIEDVKLIGRYYSMGANALSDARAAFEAIEIAAEKEALGAKP